MMRRLLFTLGLLVAFTGVVEAQQEVLRSDGRRTQVDTYLRALKTLHIPYGPEPTFDGGLVKPGSIFYNTTDSALYIWNDVEWMEVGKDPDLSNYYTVPQVDSLLTYFATIDSVNSWLAGKVDKTTTINGYPLSGDITLVASDVGALTKVLADTYYKDIAWLPDWDEVQDKPSVFPPYAHTHPISDVIGLLDSLGAKVNITTTINGQPLSADVVLTADDVGALTKALADTYYKDIDWVPAWSEITNKPTEFTPAPHTHPVSDVVGLQGLLDAKQAMVTGAASTITSADLTADRVLVSNGAGKVAASEVTAAELGRLSGVTSPIQTQIDSKVDKSTTITNTGGINIGGSLASGSVSLGLNETYLNNRYLRKDRNDGNDDYTLSVGKLVGDTVNALRLELPSLSTTTEEEYLVVDTNGVVSKRTIDQMTFDVGNSGGTAQFSVGDQDQIRFQGTGDTQVSFNAATKTIVINSVPGQGGGGVVTSVFGRDGGVVAEAGDYNTDLVTEGSNLYFTDGRVRSTELTGLTLSTSSIVATDNVLQALGKAQGQINTRAASSRELEVSGTAGRVIVSGGAQDLTQDREWIVDLVPSGVTVGTYPKVTVDTYGRVTAGASLVAADIPNLPAGKITSGTFNLARLATGTAAAGHYIDGGTGAWTPLPSTDLSNYYTRTETDGLLDDKFDIPTGTTGQYVRGDGSLAAFPTIPQGTVTSVGISVPSNLLSVTGSPVTSSGTFNVTLPNRAANLVFAGPATGAAASPAFRSLVQNDIPALAISKITGLQDALDGKEGAFSKGSLVAGDGVTLTGTLSNRLVGSGNVTISADIEEANLIAGDGISITGTYPDKTITNTAPNATHTGDVVGSQELTISNGVVTNTKLANVPTGTIKGRVATGSGSPEDLTPAQVRALINVANGATANQTDAYLLNRANHTGTQAISTITGLADELGGKELLSNKATDFSTINNVLYPSTQAVADYVAAQTPAAQTLSQPAIGQLAISGGNTVNLNTVNMSGNQTGIAGNKGWTGTHTFSTLSGTGSGIVGVNSAGTLTRTEVGDLGLVPYTGATSNVNLGARSITSTGGFLGNATSATTLATARTINGTPFNGSANITTANWGTARNITIGNTTKSVNGSANVSWSLADIGAESLTNKATAFGTLNNTLYPTTQAVANYVTAQIANIPPTDLSDYYTITQTDSAITSELLGYVPITRTITAGNGLSGGGTLASNRTITLGTPTAIGLSTTNSVTATSHTHALDAATTTAINNGQTAFSWGNHINRYVGNLVNPLTAPGSYTGDYSELPSGSYVGIVSSTATGFPSGGNGGFFSFGQVTGNITSRIFGSRQNIDGLWYSNGDPSTATTYQVASREWANEQGWLKSADLPTIGNGTLTLATGTGLTGSASFSANQSGNATFTVEAASGYAIPTTAKQTEWDTAYGWGDFRDYGLARIIAGPAGQNNDFSGVGSSFVTRQFGVGGSFFGITNTQRPQGWLIKGGASARWSWMGVTDSGPVRIYATNSANANDYVQVYHTGNLTNVSQLNNDLNYTAAGSNITLFNNNAGYIVGGSAADQVRSNSDLDERYLQSEEDPTVPEYVKNISQEDITAWTNKLTGITAGDLVSIDYTDPLNPVISAEQGELEDESVTLEKIQAISPGTLVGLGGGGTNTWQVVVPEITMPGGFSGYWSANTTYALNSAVAIGRTLYRSLSGGNQGNHPETSPSYWQQISTNFYGNYNPNVYYPPNARVSIGVGPIYYTTAGIAGIHPTSTPDNTPATPELISIGENLVLGPDNVLKASIQNLEINGLIKSGTNVTISGRGTYNDPYVINSTGGGGGSASITAGANISITGNGTTFNPYVINNTYSYSLPIATASTLGGVRVGSGLSINPATGVLSATGTEASVFTRSVNGLVPAPGGSGATRYLREDGTWATPSGGGGGGGGIDQLTGDVLASGSGSVTATIAAGAVTNAKMANMAANTIKGRVGTSGAPQDLTSSDVRKIINNVGTTSGTTIDMSGPRLVKLPAITGNVTYTLVNNHDGANVQCTVTNTSTTISAAITIPGAVGLGSLVVPPTKVAVISIQDFGGGTIRYTVITEE